MMPSNNHVLMLLLVLAMLVVLLGLVYIGLKRSNNPRAVGITLLVSGLVLGWLGLTGGMAASGFLQDFSGLPPRFLLIILPSIFVLVWFARSKRLTSWLDAIPGHYFAYAQIFRLPLELLLWKLFLDGLLPEQMTFSGYNFDVLTAVFAPVIAFGYFQRKKIPLRWAITWNIAGIMLVLVIVTIAITSTPSPLRLWDNEPANTIIAHLPFVWLPAFLVPMALMMHLASLRQLLHGSVDAYELPSDAYELKS